MNTNHCRGNSGRETDVLCAGFFSILRALVSSSPNFSLVHNVLLCLFYCCACTHRFLYLLQAVCWMILGVLLDAEFICWGIWMDPFVFQMSTAPRWWRLCHYTSTSKQKQHSKITTNEWQKCTYVTHYWGIQGLEDNPSFVLITVYWRIELYPGRFPWFEWPVLIACLFK